MEQYEKLITKALAELAASAEKLEAPTFPATPLPRPKIFRIIGCVHFPYIYRNGEISWLSLATGSEACSGSLRWHSNRGVIAKRICKLAQYQPRLILRALRQIQAAIAWCEVRAEGRKRAAEEIMRQQSAALEALDAEIAMAALK